MRHQPTKALPRSGFTLLLSMLILSAVFAITALLSRVVVRDTGSARAINNATLAYFGAESGIERGLYIIKRNRRDFQASTLAATKTAVTCGSPAAQCRTVGTGSYHTELSTTSTLTFPLLENEAYVIDYFDPDALTASPNLSSIRINAQAASSATVRPWLEVSFVRLDSLSGPSFATDPTLLLGRDPANLTTTRFAVDPSCLTCLPAVINDFNPSRPYRIRIKSLYANAARVTVEGFSLDNAAGLTIAPPGQITFKSIGTYPTGSSAKQAIEATVNWLTPSAPLFDYTLFSEQSLQKQ